MFKDDVGYLKGLIGNYEIVQKVLETEKDYSIVEITIEVGNTKGSFKDLKKAQKYIDVLKKQKRWL